MVHVCPIRATNELAAYFKPLKVMYLNSKGGILNEKGRVVEQVNFPTDYTTASSLPWCDNRTYAKMGNINTLLQKLPFTSSVVIASADSVLQELFTHRGKVAFTRIKDSILHQFRSIRLSAITISLNTANGQIRFETEESIMNTVN